MKPLRLIFVLLVSALAIGIPARWIIARQRAQAAVVVSRKPSPTPQARPVAAVAPAPSATPTPAPPEDVPSDAVFSVPSSGHIAAVIAAPDDQSAVVLSTDTSETYSLKLSLLDLHTTKPTVTEIVTGSNAEDFSTPVWGNDRHLYYEVNEEGCTASSRGRCGIYDFDPQTGKSVEIVDHVTGGLALSPDGVKLAYWDYTVGDKLTVYDIYQKSLLRQWRGLTHSEDDRAVKQMTFAADGRSVLALTYDGGKTPLKEFNLQSGTIRTLSANAEAPLSVSDGTYFVESQVNSTTGSLTHRWKRLSQTGSPVEPLNDDFPYNSIFQSGGQRRWASAFSGDGVYLYDTKTAYAEPLGSKCSLASVMSDGQTLYVTNSVISFDSQICGTPLYGAVYSPAMQAKLAEMKTLYAGTQRLSDPADQANVWYSLNRAADDLAGLMNDSSRRDPHEFSSLQKETQAAAGINIQYCEIGNLWEAQRSGYQRYLTLLPTGPVADEAWWKINVEGCGDFEPSEETLKANIAMFQDFLNRFPNSPHADEAKRQIAANQESLQESKKPEAIPTQQAATATPKQ